MHTRYQSVLKYQQQQQQLAGCADFAAAVVYKLQQRSIPGCVGTEHPSSSTWTVKLGW
jgi:hypothetical protein